MIGMMLAAGLGSRLRPLGLDVPKVLVEVGGEPLLARQIRYLAHEGVDHVVINAHHMADQVQAFVADSSLPVEITVLIEPELLGTAGGVRNALPYLGDETFVVLYADVIVDVDLSPILEAHRRTQAQATITVYESSHTEGKGRVEADADGRLVGFVEKGQPTRLPASVNAGLYLLEPAFVEHVPSGFCDFGHDVFPAALRRGQRVFTYRLPSPALDVGTQEGLAAARRLASRA